MSNKTTVALNTEQYENVINTIREGFMNKNGKAFRPNKQLSVALVLESNLGIRIGDILSLRFNDIIKDANRWRLNIIEKKTGKVRNFTVSNEIYTYIKIYCLENNIKLNAKIFRVGERNIQQQLKIAVDYLGLENVSTHSFRKYYATEMYKNSGNNVLLVTKLLQHSSPSTTQKYIGISEQEIEQAIAGHNHLI